MDDLQRTYPIDDLKAVTYAASILADPLRLHLLTELEYGAVTVSELSIRVQAAQPRVSAQLALLRQAGWVTVDTHGRQRYYRLASPQITVAIVELAAVPPPAHAAIVTPEDTSGVEPALRAARRCYDHLGGTVAVRLIDAFVDNAWLVPTNEGVGRYQPAYEVTERGARAFAERGIATQAPPTSRRRFAYACPDWTEAHPHLGGVLAARVFQQLEHAGVVQRLAGTRAVHVSAALEHWLEP